MALFSSTARSLIFNNGPTLLQHHESHLLMQKKVSHPKLLTLGLPYDDHQLELTAKPLLTKFGLMTLQPLVPACVHWPDLFLGRSLVQETGLFVGLVCLHLYYNVVVHLSSGPAERAEKKIRQMLKKESESCVERYFPCTTNKSRCD